MSNIMPVSFYGDTLALIEHKGEPFVAMKAVVENMGLAWHGQFEKLREKFNSVIQEIRTTGGDGKQYEMICLPLRKIPAFLYSINPNKVKPELRDKIIQYQDECDEVLWQYWTKGYAGNAAMVPTITQQIAASKERSRLLKDLKKETHPNLRKAIYQQVEHISRIMGIDAEPDSLKLETIGRTIITDPLIEDFWDAVNLIGLDELNHSIPKDTIAINLVHFSQRAAEEKLDIPSINEIRRVLSESVSPRFIEQKKVWSRIKKNAMSCWVFQN